jgi:hypothetical protein
MSEKESNIVKNVCSDCNKKKRISKNCSFGRCSGCCSLNKGYCGFNGHTNMKYRLLKERFGKVQKKIDILLKTHDEINKKIIK